MAAVAVAAISAASYGVYWSHTGQFLQSTDDAYVGGDVTVMAPKVSGLIADVVVTDNQTVHAGDLLVKIDDRDFRAKLAYVEGDVAAKKAAIANIEASLTLQQSLIAQAEAGLTGAQVESKRAVGDQQRRDALVGTSAVSLEDVDHARADRKVADAALAKATNGLAAAKDALAVLMAQKDQAIAALQQAQAQRDLAKLDLDYTELRAPIDGVIGNRSARTGAYAAAGSSLLSIVPSKALWIDANFKESQLANVKAGQAVTIHADVLPGLAFMGHVESLAPATGAQFSILPPENATGNFTKIVQRVPVRVALDGDAATLGRLRPGLSVSVTVDERSGGTAKTEQKLEQKPQLLAQER